MESVYSVCLCQSSCQGSKWLSNVKHLNVTYAAALLLQRPNHPCYSRTFSVRAQAQSRMPQKGSLTCHHFCSVFCGQSPLESPYPHCNCGIQKHLIVTTWLSVVIEVAQVLMFVMVVVYSRSRAFALGEYIGSYAMSTWLRVEWYQPTGWFSRRVIISVSLQSFKLLQSI